MSGIMIRHYCCGGSSSLCLTFIKVDKVGTWYSVLKKIGILYNYFSSIVVFFHCRILKVDLFGNKMICVESAFFFNKRGWLSRDDAYCEERLKIQGDFTRNENAKFFIFLLPDNTKCGYRTYVRKQHCHLLQLSRHVEKRSRRFRFLCLQPGNISTKTDFFLWYLPILHPIMTCGLRVAGVDPEDGLR